MRDARTGDEALKDLQSHFDKRARMGKMLAMKGKAVVVALKP